MGPPKAGGGEAAGKATEQKLAAAPAVLEEEEEKKKKKECVYTPYGCGDVIERRGDTVVVCLYPWNGRLYTSTSNIKTELEFSIVTLIDDMLPWNCVFNLSQTLGEVKKTVADHYGLLPEEVRLISGGSEVRAFTAPQPSASPLFNNFAFGLGGRPVGTTAAAAAAAAAQAASDSVPLGHCRLSLQQPFEFLLVVDEKARFVLDMGSKLNGIEISEDGSSASMSEDFLPNSDLTVRSSTDVKEGVSYWDVRLDRCTKGRMNLGVCLINMGLGCYAGANNNGWSYFGQNGNAETAGQSVAYAEPFRTGDIIRVRVDTKARTLSFCKNGVDLGVAHNNLPAKVYPAFSLFYPGDRFSIVRFGHVPLPPGESSAPAAAAAADAASAAPLLVAGGAEPKKKPAKR